MNIILNSPYVFTDSLVSMDSYFELQSNTILFYSDHSGFVHWEFFHVVPVFLTSFIIVGVQCFYFTLNFLTLQDAPASACMFPIPVLELPFLPGAPVPFIGTCY